MNTLENPSKHDCRKKLLPDEPIFILRGKDPNASKTIHYWVAGYLQRGGRNLKKVCEALDLAQQMEEWRKEHIKKEKQSA